MASKVCSKCKVDKPYSDYHRDNKRAIGIRCKCKPCCKLDTYTWRERNKSKYNNYAAMWRAKNPERRVASEIKHHYKLSIERYNEMLAQQKSRCKICGKPHDPGRSRGRLYVDHCHASNVVRGLLCSHCNTGLGYFKDDVGLMKRAIAYVATNGALLD